MAPIGMGGMVLIRYESSHRVHFRNAGEQIYDAQSVDHTEKSLPQPDLARPKRQILQLSYDMAYPGKLSRISRTWAGQYGTRHGVYFVNAWVSLKLNLSMLLSYSSLYIRCYSTMFNSCRGTPSPVRSG